MPVLRNMKLLIEAKRHSLFFGAESLNMRFPALSLSAEQYFAYTVSGRYLIAGIYIYVCVILKTVFSHGPLIHWTLTGYSSGSQWTKGVLGKLPEIFNISLCSLEL
jgi:hypothetical protein